MLNSTCDQNNNNLVNDSHKTDNSNEIEIILGIKVMVLQFTFYVIPITHPMLSVINTLHKT